MDDKKKKVVLVIAPKNFRDEEYFKTRVVIVSSGIETITVAKTKEEEVTGSLGGKARIDLSLNKVKSSDYDGIVFVGGSGSKIYFEDANAQKLAKEFFDKGKVVAAICIAPSVLANAGILAGKKATSYSTQKANLVSKGAKFDDKKIVVDGKVVTAQGPDYAQGFGEAVAKVLNK